MNNIWEKLIIDSFAKTIDIQTTKTSFDDFFDCHAIEIFKKFHIKNSAKEEYELIKGIFLNASSDPLCLKSITLEMSENIPYDDIEEFTFCCICPIITGVIKKHRELKPYLEQTGIVYIPFSVSEADLVKGKGDYYIIDSKIFKRSWNGKIVSIGNANSLEEAMDFCHRDSQKGIAACVGIVGLVIVGGYFWFVK